MAYSYGLLYLPGQTITVKIWDGTSLVATSTPTESVTRAGYYAGSGVETITDGWYTADILISGSKVADMEVHFESNVGDFNPFALLQSTSASISVTVSPALAIQVQEPYPATNLEAIANEVSPTKTLLIVDGDGVAVDMTGKSLTIIFKRMSDGTRIVSTDITIDTNSVTFVIPDDVIDNHGKYTWACRENTTNTRYAHGLLTVKDVPV